MVASLLLPKPDWIKLFETSDHIEINSEITYRNRIGYYLVFKDVPVKLFWKRSTYKKIDVYLLILGQAGVGIVFVKKGNKQYRVRIRTEPEEITIEDYTRYVVKMLDVIKEIREREGQWYSNCLDIIKTASAFTYDLKLKKFHKAREIIMRKVLDYLLKEIPDEWCYNTTGLSSFMEWVKFYTPIEITESLLKDFINKFSRKSFFNDWMKIYYMQIVVEPDLGGDLELLRKVDEMYKRLLNHEKKALRRIFKKVIAIALEKEGAYDLSIVSDSLAEVV